MLIGVGWSVVILIYWLKHRGVLDLRGKMGPAVTFLTVATLLTFVIFFRRESISCLRRLSSASTSPTCGSVPPGLQKSPNSSALRR